MTVEALKQAWERARDRAKLGDLHFHDLRHEAISRFCEMGLTLPEIALADLVPRLRTVLLTRSAEDWERLLADAVPCSVARAVEEMFDHPQTAAEDLMASIPHPTLGSYRGVTRSIKFSRTPGPDPFAAPLLDGDGSTLNPGVC